MNVIMSCKHTTPFFCVSPTFVIFLWELIAFFWTHFGVYDRLLDTFLDFNLGCPVPNFQSIQIWLFLCRLGLRSVIKFWCSRNRRQLISKKMFILFFFTEPFIFITTIFSCFISVRMLRQLVFSSRLSQSQFRVQYGGGDQ